MNSAIKNNDLGPKVIVKNPSVKVFKNNNIKFLLTVIYYPSQAILVAKLQILHRVIKGMREETNNRLRQMVDILSGISTTILAVF